MNSRNYQIIIAHRGASFDAPENTVASVLLAWSQGADAVEVDVQLSRDGQIVVLHDANLEKLFGLRKEVRELDLSELRKLDAGSHKGERWAGERIPILEEILETIPDGKRLFIEIKTGPEILEPLGKILQKWEKDPQQVVPIGFDLETMQAVKKRFPKHPVCLVSRLRKGAYDFAETRPTAKELVAAIRVAGLDGLDVEASKAVDRDFARTIKAAGLGLMVWTVNDPAEAQRMFEAGVDGVTTDRPGWLREQIERG